LEEKEQVHLNEAPGATKESTCWEVKDELRGEGVS
jgi:hypothetical protein